MLLRKLDFYVKFDCKRSTRMLSFAIKCSMRDPICDSIKCCVKICYVCKRIVQCYMMK